MQILIKAYNSLMSQAAIPALEWSDALANAARDLCNDNHARGVIDHIGSDGSKVYHRVERYSKFS